MAAEGTAQPHVGEIYIYKDKRHLKLEAGSVTF